MKNKIKVIDFSIVSTYMGRYLTAVVAVLMFAITLSALLSGGGTPVEGTVIVGVPSRGDAETTLDFFEPLRSLLERNIAMTVRLEVCEDSWPESCDFLVMSVHEFQRLRESESLVAIFSVEPPGGWSGAAIIAGGSVGEIPSDVSGDDALFTAPHSINGCWVQLRALEERGVVFPAMLDELEFAPPPGHAERVVYSVATGRYRLGAVPRRVVSRMISEGKIAADEVAIVATLPSMPETVLCHREGGRVPEPLTTRAETVFGPVLSPIGAAEIAQLDALFEYVSSRR